MTPLNTLSLAHDFVQKHVPVGGFCIDATAGRGGDTLFLSRLVGDQGRVLAFDIQQQAVDITRSRLEEAGCTNAQVILDSHANMENYAQAGTVDAILFNFGYLPGGDHNIYTRAESSIAAIEAGLRLLKSNAVMSLCIYHGGDNGDEEKDALLQYFRIIDSKQYTVLVTEFVNRPNNPPIPVFILKRT